MSKIKMNTLKITVNAMLMAIYFVLDRFAAVNLLTNEYKLSFIPVILAAVMFGPVYGMLVGGLGDLLSAIIMPTGPYFPGFTIVSALMGLIFGLFCRKKMSYPRIISSILVNQLFCSLVLNTFNLAFYFIINNINKYGKSVFAIFGALLVSRLIQAGIYIAAEIVFMIMLFKLMPAIEKALPKGFAILCQQNLTVGEKCGRYGNKNGDEN